MDTYDPATVFSSIDHGGRYAYGNQPAIITWNLARLAEAMLPLFDVDTDRAIEMATGVLQSFPERFQTAWSGEMHAKLGLPPDGKGGVGKGDVGTDGDAAAGDELVADLLSLMAEQRVDYTSCLRSLSSVLRGDATAARSLFGDPDAFSAWSERWLTVVGDQPAVTADGMDRVNPIYVPRNHLVEEALTAATAGDLGPFEELLEVITNPYEVRPGRERYELPAPSDFGVAYRTFCGT
jgi:uncharacterized protein YdiU (UPF0061 family)